jgi:lysophospholipase L1-like esterase
MKQRENRQYEPLMMVLASILILLVLSFTHAGFRIGSFETRKVNLLAEITTAPGTLAKAAPDALKTLVDTLIVKQIRNADKITVPLDQYTGILQFGTDSTGGLRHFFAALHHLGKDRKKVRIAYFGDSMIEGDLITQDIRSLLQDEFGGEGVGFMPVTSIVAGFRQSIIHAFSPNWKDYTLLDAVPADHGLGITGHTFLPQYTAGEKDSVESGNESWVRYSAVSRKRLNKFGSVKMFYGRSDGHNAVSLKGKKAMSLPGNSAVNELCMCPNPVQGFTAVFNCSTPLNVYGFTMEGDSGVVLDNFSFRGNSGMPLTKMPYSVLAGLNKYLNYDLIILQYGVNVVNDKVKDFSWYEKGMTEVVRHLQNCFPDASILVIGAGDKSTRIEGEYITDPSVPLVVEAQRRVAEKTNTSFWNFYQAMGGEGSMVKWVKGDTCYANSDYTHFNSRGARRVGGLLYNYIIGEYKKDKKAG